MMLSNRNTIQRTQMSHSSPVLIPSSLTTIRVVSNKATRLACLSRLALHAAPERFGVLTFRSLVILLRQGPSYRYLVDEYCPQAKRYRISSIDDRSHWVYEGFHRKQEIILYVLPLALFDVVYPRRQLPVLPPSFARLASEVFLSLFFYDLFFTIGHYICHKNSWLYRNMHAKHHAKKVQRVTEAFRLSVGDQVLDVGCSIAALNLVRAHPLSRTVYNAVIVYLIIELHSDCCFVVPSWKHACWCSNQWYDFPWMLQNIVPFGLWGGSARHDAHHVHGTVHFQKFFTYLDTLLGTTVEARCGGARDCDSGVDERLTGSTSVENVSSQ